MLFNYKCSGAAIDERPLYRFGDYLFGGLRFAACGLNANSELDCNTTSLNFTGIPDLSDFPLGEQFLNIQSVETGFFQSLTTGFSGIGGPSEPGLSGTTLCGERLDSSFQCSFESARFSDIENPNAVSQDILDMRLDMDARIYGTASVEIFWTPVLVEGRSVEVEIVRNGELLDRVNARQSYHDANALSTNTYQMRLVDELGNTGLLSPDLIVATAAGTVLFNGEPPLSASRQDASDSEDIFTSLIATAVARGSLAYWTIDEDQQPLIDGFEIELNGRGVGFTRSQLYLNLEERIGSCFRVSAIDFNGETIDSANIGSGCS